MDAKQKAAAIVAKMMETDVYSQWLGIKVLETGVGTSKLQMTVREEMCNGFGITHGGISYSFADSALAFSSNSHGIQSVSIETSISHTRPVKTGDVLTAIAEELNISTKIGVYQITVTNQENKTVGLFKGTVFRTGKEWEL
jgi:acyl-CoA thioesterase